MSNPIPHASDNSFRSRLYHIVFESDTRAGKAFDVVLILAIVLSVIVVMLESIDKARQNYGELLVIAEWVFTILFTLEYLVRLWIAESPGKYARSFFGIVDLMSVIPTYASLLVPGAQFLLVIRFLRILRVFRVLKLMHYLSEANELASAIRASRRKITVFIFTMMTLVVILGSLMYLIEGKENGFTSIPRSIYWAIVTLTTVGYGDISPQTNLGQTLAAFIMITGYGIIAVPTGIVTVEISRAREHGTEQKSSKTKREECSRCGTEGHPSDARFCRVCGERLPHVSKGNLASGSASEQHSI